MQFVWAIALLVVSYAIQALTAKKPVGVDAKPATFEEFKFPQWEEGTPQAVVFGDVWTGDWMVTGVTNYKVEAIRSTGSGSGGKK